MTDVLIKRELLERVAQYTPSIDRQEDRARAISELRSILESAPRQPEGDADEALLWIDDFIARCNGDDRGSCESVSVVQRAIAELREECEHLKACQENAMLHMTGLVAERNTLRQQRDNLAGLLRDALKLGELDRVLSLRTRAIAALAEVEKK